MLHYAYTLRCRQRSARPASHPAQRNVQRARGVIHLAGRHVCTGVDAVTSVRVGSESPSTGTGARRLTARENRALRHWPDYWSYRLLIQRLAGCSHRGINCVSIELSRQRLA